MSYEPILEGKKAVLLCLREVLTALLPVLVGYKIRKEQSGCIKAYASFQVPLGSPDNVVVSIMHQFVILAYSWKNLIHSIFHIVLLIYNRIFLFG